MSSNNDTTISGEAANSTHDGPTVGADGDIPDRNRRLGRRTFIKGLGASAATVAALGHDDLLVDDAEAVLPVLAAGLVTGAAAGIAFGAAIGGPDESQVADAISWNEHVDEYTRAREDQAMLDSAMASLERDVQLVENKAREQAIFRIYEEGVDSGTTTTATDAATAAIDEVYATVERAILNTWSMRYNRAHYLHKSVGNTSGLNYPQVFAVIKSNGSDYTIGYPEDQGFTDGDPATTSHTLLNGDNITYNGHSDWKGYQDDQNTRTEWGYDPLTSKSQDSQYDYIRATAVRKPDSADYATSDDSVSGENWYKLFDAARFETLLDDLYNEHSNMISEVSSMVDSYFTPAQNGEIDLFEAVGPQHLTDTASTAEDYQEAAMALRAMGYPMSKQVATIEVPTDDGGNLELTGRLSWTAHQGNGLAVGKTHAPSNIPGSIFAAVNLPEDVDTLTATNTTDTNTTNTTDTDSDSTGPGAEIVELTGGFEILSAEGAEKVTFEDRTLASSDLTNEQINEIYKENYDANQEATETVHETATGGGGGWSGMGTTGKALIVGALGAAGIGILNN